MSSRLHPTTKDIPLALIFGPFSSRVLSDPAVPLSSTAVMSLVNAAIVLNVRNWRKAQSRWNLYSYRFVLFLDEKDEVRRLTSRTSDIACCRLLDLPISTKRERRKGDKTYMSVQGVNEMIDRTDGDGIPQDPGLQSRFCQDIL